MRCLQNRGVFELWHGSHDFLCAVARPSRHFAVGSIMSERPNHATRLRLSRVADVILGILFCAELIATDRCPSATLLTGILLWFASHRLGSSVPLLYLHFC